jgi:hypothetical protein
MNQPPPPKSEPKVKKVFPKIVIQQDIPNGPPMVPEAPKFIPGPPTAPTSGPPIKQISKVVTKEIKVVKKPEPEYNNYEECYKFTESLKPFVNRKTHITIESQKKFKALKEVQIVHISDTHLKMEKKFNKLIGKCDILIHTGDFTNAGGLKELRDFNEALGKCTQAKHKGKIDLSNLKSCHWRKS